jgi:hypothetical protein
VGDAGWALVTMFWLSLLLGVVLSHNARSTDSE